MVSVDLDEEVRKLRELVRKQADDLDRLAGDALSGSYSRVGITLTLVAYPTIAQGVYAVQIQTLSGVETEGSVVSVSGSSGVVLAANIGSKIPSPGTQIVITHVPYAWVFRYG